MSLGYSVATYTGIGGRNEEFIVRVGSNSIVNAGFGDDYVLTSVGSNTITGGQGRDYIDATSGDNLIAGDDSLYSYGATGDADWILGWGADTIFGGAGNDFVNARGGDDRVDGGDGNDVLWGGYGSDAISGGAGNDVLFGGSGTGEPYAFSILVGYSGETDAAIASHVWAGVSGELALDDNGDDYLYGDAGFDTLYGQGGNDTLDGGSDSDTMFGGTGNDTYLVDKSSDVVIEYAGEGYDTVLTTTSFSLNPNSEVESLTALGPASVKLLGNSISNAIAGSSGDDSINGAHGNDTLTGGTGKDKFVFNTKLGTSKTDRKVNFDKITDFSVKNDSIWLDNAIFKKLGAGSGSHPKQLKADYFNVGGRAADKNDFILYNKKTGILSYDADGSGKGKAVEFAQLAKNLKLTEKDFFVV
ncbi:calcium-binding protein [Microvirga sp. HBU67558]|uniref:calcium-binding protein n=1 Tax=Microvirga TaxID=186650 RepID=UPI001B370043|nr:MULTISPECIES: calcium-binding protein [unclassified Microvirga]MBQ0820541.1 calcium-binding protein [Microvirga sp. HBU67558]